MSKRVTKVPKVATLEGQGTELVLGKVVSVDIQMKAIYLEEMKDGRWRLTYTKSLIPDIEQLSAIRFTPKTE